MEFAETAMLEQVVEVFFQTMEFSMHHNEGLNRVVIIYLLKTCKLHIGLHFIAASS